MEQVISVLQSRRIQRCANMKRRRSLYMHGDGPAPISDREMQGLLEASSEKAWRWYLQNKVNGSDCIVHCIALHFVPHCIAWPQHRPPSSPNSCDAVVQSAYLYPLTTSCSSNLRFESGTHILYSCRGTLWIGEDGGREIREHNVKCEESSILG